MLKQNTKFRAGSYSYLHKFFSHFVFLYPSGPIPMSIVFLSSDRSSFAGAFTNLWEKKYEILKMFHYFSKLLLISYNLQILFEVDIVKQQKVDFSHLCTIDIFIL